MGRVVRRACRRPARALLRGLRRRAACRGRRGRRAHRPDAGSRRRRRGSAARAPVGRHVVVVGAALPRGGRLIHDPGAQHRLPALARHGALRPALRAPRPDAEHPAAGGSGRPVPPGLLRIAVMLGQPRGVRHRPVPAHERDDGPRPPRLPPARCEPSPPAHAARGRRLPLRAHRRAAHRERSVRARLRPRPPDLEHARGAGRAACRRGPARRASRAVLPLGRLLRDPPELLRAELGARHAVLPAARQPARPPRGARGHGGVQGQRALARPRRRRRPHGAHGERPVGADARRLHHRPRPGLPRRQGDAHRPRHRGAAHRPRPGRVLGRARGQRPGLAAGRVPDAVRARRRSSRRTSSRGAR